jgi:hydroxyacylglutathione hydrolase
VIVHKETVGPFYENCYILADDHIKSAVIIDPGGDGQRLASIIESRQYLLQSILNTHGHIDHIAAVHELQHKFKIPFYLHAEDETIVQQAENYAALFGYPFDKTPTVNRPLSDGQILTLGAAEIVVIHTPGHTRGSCCFYIASEKVLLSGDTLFRESIGRTDLPGGDYPAIQQSIKSKLYALPDNITVYPGHGPKTTIGYEKANNPFVK